MQSCEDQVHQLFTLVVVEAQQKVNRLYFTYVSTRALNLYHNFYARYLVGYVRVGIFM